IRDHGSSPQVESHDALRLAGELVSLEVVEEPRPVGMGDGLRREQLPAEALLLRRSRVGELQQDRVEKSRVNAGGLPTRVEVAGFLLGSDEAAVKVRAAAA